MELNVNAQMQFTKGNKFITSYSGLEDKFKRGIGVNAEFAYYLSDNFSLGLEAGLNSIKAYKLKTTSVEYKPKIFSTLLKPRYYFSNGAVRPYLEAGVGLARMKLDAKGTSKDKKIKAPGDLTKTRMLIAPGAGIRVKLTDFMNINAGVRYNMMKGFRYLQAQGGLSFLIN